MKIPKIVSLAVMIYITYRLATDKRYESFRNKLIQHRHQKTNLTAKKSNQTDVNNEIKQIRKLLEK